ncbi:amino acid permease [Chrysochromulina tobinii]|uniref:Amino acid permease n=1 Tax=Chrysochromulina tobinii TaxID=1460289 RepID=A0A0M0LRC9_9EUKA|nr:amino acid permease [Chrysochromulina tobinii]|eukprot:KOO53599.1 amino acid permease [Chrysochromulina sp. CCMP291]
MFIAWSAVILGSVPYDAAAAASASGATFDPLAVLRASGDSFGSTVRLFSLLAVCTSFVGFYYGLTDFFADVLGFDTKGVGSSDGGEQNMAVLEPKVAKKALAVREEEEEEEKGQEEAAAPITALRTPGEKALLGAPTTALRTPGEKALLGALTLLPPLGFAVGDPSIFFSALDNGGTYGVMTLFGILPAAMAWAQRYGEGRDPDTAFAEEALPGGKLTLLAMIAAGAAFVSVETWERIEALT